MLNTIGPVWDGNEVWLVTGGGAIFAAFPNVYATLFSGVLLPFMLLLTALIFRAVSIEFRSKQANAAWRRRWDVGFCRRQLLAACCWACSWATRLGHSAGCPSTSTSAGLLGLLHPYALLVGVTTVALFMMHGAIYLVMKTEGELHDRSATGSATP